MYVNDQKSKQDKNVQNLIKTRAKNKQGARKYPLRENTLHHPMYDLTSDTKCYRNVVFLSRQTTSSILKFLMQNHNPSSATWSNCDFCPFDFHHANKCTSDTFLMYVRHRVSFTRLFSILMPTKWLK